MHAFAGALRNLKLKSFVCFKSEPRSKIRFKEIFYYKIQNSILKCESILKHFYQNRCHFIHTFHSDYDKTKFIHLIGLKYRSCRELEYLSA